VRIGSKEIYGTVLGPLEHFGIYGAAPDAVWDFMDQNAGLTGAVVSAMAHRTSAAPPLEGHPGSANARRPMWTHPDLDLAAVCHSTPDAIDGVIKKLELQGLIEVRRYGRNNVYRLIFENFPGAGHRVPRKPPKSEETLHPETVDAEEEQPVPIAVGQFVLRPQQPAEVKFERPCHVSVIRMSVTDLPGVSTRIEEHRGVIDIGLFREDAFVENTPVSSSTSVQQHGYRAEQETPKRAPPQPIRADTEPPKARTNTRLRAELNRLLQPHLGPIEDATLSRIVTKLQDTRVTLEELVPRIGQRMKMFTGRDRSWGGVLALIDGLAKAKAEQAEAERAHPHPPLREQVRDRLAEQEEEARREEELQAFIDQQLAELPAEERAKLTKGFQREAAKTIQKWEFRTPPQREEIVESMLRNHIRRKAQGL
jgi:hypothetical protein